jgi:probable rRNA maturation factor
MSVDCIIEERRWEALDLPALAERAAGAAFAALGVTGEGFALAVLGCDDARIAALNGDFRGRARPTNVLSWPSEERGSGVAGVAPELPEPGPAEDAVELGDVALAYETCAREAEEAGRPLADHVTHLVIHAVLHLLGYDHGDEADARLMEGIEVRALALLGLPDPY